MQSTTIFQRLYRLRIYILCGVGAMVLQACKSFVQVDLPNNMLTNALVFTNVATADAALLDVYGKLRGSSPGASNSILGITRDAGVFTDELEAHLSLTGGISGQFYHNNLIPDNSYIAQNWSTSFNLIYGTNSILEGVDLASDQMIKPEDKLRLRGEALFIRSFVNLYLTQLFGDIPWITTTDYQVNMKLPRTEVGQIHDYLVDDLKLAIEYLPETYPSVERVRPNASVARALLARLYLYMDKWEEAEDMADQLITNPLFRLRTGEELGQVFLKDSPETIWQFAHQEANYPTGEATLYYWTTAPPSSVSLSEHLISTFADEDKRMQLWIVPVVSPQGDTFYFSRKYVNRIYGSNTTEMSIRFRLAEQYLIRAESRIRQEKMEEGRSDLNQTRVRAGLAPITSLDPQVLLNELLDERFRELFIEHPHRLVDVIRMGRTDIFEARKPGWTDRSKLFPVPMKEMELNPNLKPQNPGYE